MKNLKFDLDEFAHNKFVILEEAFSLDVIKSALRLAQDYHQKNQLKKAQVGKGALQKRLASVRGDQILWLRDWKAEPLPSLYQGFKFIEEQLRFLFLPIKRFESHMALYQPGDYYLKHKDRHQKSPHRLITCVLYLGEWEPDMQGELNIYLKDKVQVIHPQQGRLVLFASELEHEVVPTQKDRWSLTTWFRDDIDVNVHL